MPSSLIARLPQLLPLAIDWVQETEGVCLAHGTALTSWQQADAMDVGVVNPDKVKICLVDRVPQPVHPELLAASREIRFLTPSTLGLTLGYGIFIRKTHDGQRWLLRHELRHVAQCEQAGGLGGFLTEYLRQVVSLGYDQAPLEIDARRYEQRSPSDPQKGKSA